MVARRDKLCYYNAIMTSYPNVVVLGRPNVGKSTLFNRLIGKKEAIESPIAGTTRDRLYGEVVWHGKKFNLIDIAGVDYNGKEEIDLNMQASVNVAIEQADLILFIVDWNEKNNEHDKLIARSLRKTTKPVILAINKADNMERIKDSEEFNRLGSFISVAVSGISGIGTGDLLDEIIKKLPKAKIVEEKKTEEINLAIIGRPNVGKSTLLNTIIGEKRAIVSAIPGTTRDRVTVKFMHKGMTINMVDTAGIRRPGKIKWDSIEKFSLFRTERAIRESDVVVLMIDGTEGLVSSDANILGKAKEWGKGVVLGINKIDLWGERKEDKVAITIAYLQRKLNFIPWAPIVFISAEADENISPLLNQVVTAYKNRLVMIPEADLQQIFEQAKNDNQQLENITSLTQKRTKPPIFTATYKGRKEPHQTQMRYIENKIRDVYPLNGTPIFIDLISKRTK